MLLRLAYNPAWTQFRPLKPVPVVVSGQCNWSLNEREATIPGFITIDVYLGVVIWEIWGYGPSTSLGPRRPPDKVSVQCSLHNSRVPVWMSVQYSWRKTIVLYVLNLLSTPAVTRIIVGEIFVFDWLIIWCRCVCWNIVCICNMITLICDIKVVIRLPHLHDWQPRWTQTSNAKTATAFISYKSLYLLGFRYRWN